MARWFSAALKALETLQPKGGKEQMLNTLSKQPGVKKEEMDFLRLDELFNGEDVITVDQLQKAIRDRLRLVDGFENDGLIHTDIFSDNKTFGTRRSHAHADYKDLPGTENTSLAGVSNYPGSQYTKFHRRGTIDDDPMAYEERVVSVPRSGQPSADLDVSESHFPSPNEDRINIGHTRGGTGRVAPLNFDPDARPHIEDAYILDELQSDLMQQIQLQQKLGREAQERLAGQAASIQPALYYRWNSDPRLRREEAIRLLRKMTQPRGKGKDVPGDLTVEHGEFVYGSGDRLLGTIDKDGFPDDELIMNAEAAFMGINGEDFTKQFFVDGFEKDDGRMRSFIEDVIGEELPIIKTSDRVVKELAELEAQRSNLPFQKSWPEVLLKDAIQEAVARDVEQFGFLSGDEVAKRWHQKGDGQYEGLKSFYDNRLVNSKLWKELGLPKPEFNLGTGNTTFEARTVPLSPEFKKRVREQGLPLFSLGALTMFGPYEERGALSQ